MELWVSQMTDKSIHLYTELNNKLYNYIKFVCNADLYFGKSDVFLLNIII